VDVLRVSQYFDSPLSLTQNLSTRSGGVAFVQAQVIRIELINSGEHNKLRESFFTAQLPFYTHFPIYGDI
jgi:hypothetical protein